MKTITDSLKNFYAKLGGNPSNLPSRSTSADIIDAMSDVYTDKEGTHVEVTTQVTEGTKIATIKTNNEDHDIYAPTELPSVTSSDKDKVLSVNSSGAWIAANAPCKELDIYTLVSGTTVSINDSYNTFADFKSAVTNDNVIAFLLIQAYAPGMGSYSNKVMFNGSMYKKSSSADKLIFSGWIYPSMGSVAKYVTVEFNNSLEGVLTEYTMTPAT